MTKDKLLKAYWFSFPEDETFPMGMGVTAFSIDDAHSLLDEMGYSYHRDAKRVEVVEGITDEQLEKQHVKPNMGPMVMRGIWYPCLNIGLGASGERRRR